MSTTTDSTAAGLVKQRDCYDEIDDFPDTCAWCGSEDSSENPLLYSVGDSGRWADLICRKDARLEPADIVRLPLYQEGQSSPRTIVRRSAE